MRRSILTVLVALAVLFFSSVPEDAQARGRGGWHGGGGRGHGWHGGGHGHGYYRYPRVVFGVGAPAFWWGAPYYGYGYGYGYPGYVYAPPRVVVTERPVYVQRSEAAPAAYWYYCESEGGYYPDVPTCPEEWVPVPPRPDSDY